MAFNKLEDTNALLLYRVGPVLMCSPTLQVESVTVPPAISRASVASDAEPGMFKSIYGMVRVVDLRMRFGVDASQHKQPGQIIIVEVTGGHAGFWVDEIEDVIGFPQTGWSQVPSHVPGSVFSRALMQGDDIRLYAEFDRLDGFKASGYLREHIRSLQQAVPRQEAASTAQQTQSAQPQSTMSHTATARSAETTAKADTQLIRRSSEASMAMADSISSPIKSPLKSGEKPAVSHNIGSQHAAADQAINAQQSGAHDRPALPPGLAQTSTHQSPSRPAQHKDGRMTLSIPDSNDSIVSSAVSSENQASRVDSDDLQTQTRSTVVESEQAGTRWLWWFVPLLLLFVVLFMLMQNSRLLQRLIAQDEPPALQARVDLQQDAVTFQTEKMLDIDAVEDEVSASAVADIEVKPTAQMADDLTDVIYIEPDSGDLIITVNDYEEDDLSDHELPVEASAQNQITAQAVPDNKQELLQQQLLPEDKTVVAESIQADTTQPVVSTQNDKHEVEKISSVKKGATDKTAAQVSRRMQHIVVKGDTLWSITGRYINKPWRFPEVARLSDIDNPHLIYPGQRVVIVVNYKKPSE